MVNFATTQPQLTDDVSALRQRIAELEAQLAEQVSTREVVRDGENTFRSFIKQSSDGIFVIDDQGIIIEWNQAQVQLTGIKRDEAIGQFLGDVPLSYVRNVDGSRRAVQTRTFPLRMGHKLAIGSINRDISRLKQSEETLRDRTLILKERNEELDAFAHTVAHDLKSPLSIIITYATMLEGNYTTLADEECRHDVREIGSAAQRMFRIIDELLLLAGLREAEITIEPIDMAHVVTSVQDRLALIIETSQAEIASPAVWPEAMGYAPWLEEVWANYLSNAIKYGGQPPHIELGATLIASENCVQYWIRDNGTGLTEQAQSRLFRPFTRLDQLRAQGHGLGLSIVRRIVEKLNGTVGVKSEPGQGSTFFFTLPCA